ncbi:MAG: hypothetical protein IPF51_12330 [Dehalococcoidia bacterium]|uniref:hypothetical protein n=1 Tax=Candidatus Amarobacter glycogenicus TaxID=3140699 RepID=UPI0031373BA9|nr:hypothetical protein [Dehalococcoidia bacterium]
MQEAAPLPDRTLRRRRPVEFATSARAQPDTNALVALASQFRSGPPSMPAPETSVCVEVETPEGNFELVAVYVPSIARKDGVKVPTQHAMHALMARGAGRPQAFVAT